MRRIAHRRAGRGGIPTKRGSCGCCRLVPHQATFALAMIVVADDRDPHLCGIQSAQVAAELQELGALLARFDVPEQVVTGQIAGGEQVAGPVVAVAGGATTGARLTLRVLVPATALGPVPTGVGASD